MADKGKILVIDDDPNFLEFARIVLESGGYEVHTAENASEGLTIMRQIKPNAVLLDVMISYIFNGLNVTKGMRDDPELRDIPLILISAIVNPEEAALLPAFQNHHADIFMPKPIEPSELLEQVDKLVACQNSKQEEKHGFTGNSQG